MCGSRSISNWFKVRFVSQCKNKDSQNAQAHICVFIDENISGGVSLTAVLPLFIIMNSYCSTSNCLNHPTACFSLTCVFFFTDVQLVATPMFLSNDWLGVCAQEGPVRGTQSRMMHGRLLSEALLLLSSLDVLLCSSLLTLWLSGCDKLMAPGAENSCMLGNTATPTHVHHWSPEFSRLWFRFLIWFSVVPLAEACAEFLEAALLIFLLGGVYQSCSCWMFSSCKPGFLHGLTAGTVCVRVCVSPCMMDESGWILFSSVVFSVVE